MLDKHLIAATSPLARPENIVCWRTYRITLLEDRFFRIERDDNQHFCDEATLSVWFRNSEKVDCTAENDGSSLTITTECVTLCIKEPFRSSYVVIDGKKRPLNNAGNLRGTYRTLDECDGGYRVDGERRIPITPDYGVLSKTGVAILDDTKTPLLGTDGMPKERPETMSDLYVFAYGRDYRAAIRGLYRITGSPPLIPRYALGCWWSRNHTYTDREYLHLIDRMRAEGLSLTQAWLPQGHWTDIFTGDEYDGGCVTTLARWLDSIPVLLREGGILVLDGRDLRDLSRT